MVTYFILAIMVAIVAVVIKTGAWKVVLIPTEPGKSDPDTCWYCGRPFGKKKKVRVKHENVETFFHEDKCFDMAVSGVYGKNKKEKEEEESVKV